MIRFDVLTIFPQLFVAFSETGVLGKAVDRGLVEIGVHDLRDWADNKWRQLDDEPYGGGAGMVMQAPPVLAALRELSDRAELSPRFIAIGPRGRVLDHALADELRSSPHLVLLCGRYEGFDERVFELFPMEEISIGDYILGGGEVAAMVLVEAVSRLVPGVVGDPDSVADDSFGNGLLDCPCYTRPAEVEGAPVPAVLTSGDHEAVRCWRLERAVEATVTRRPDLVRENWGVYSEEVRSLVRALAPSLAPGGGDD
jgi:tRNA (guanine37-N1)-methyltransferase